MNDVDDLVSTSAGTLGADEHPADDVGSGQVCLQTILWARDCSIAGGSPGAQWPPSAPAADPRSSRALSLGLLIT